MLCWWHSSVARLMNQPQRIRTSPHLLQSCKFDLLPHVLHLSSFSKGGHTSRIWDMTGVNECLSQSLAIGDAPLYIIAGGTTLPDRPDAAVGLMSLCRRTIRLQLQIGTVIQYSDDT